jgi:hypothetical protein
MITFYCNLDVSTLSIEKLLCLPFFIEEIELEVEYSISKYHAATFWSPAEGGAIEDLNWKIIKVYDENVNGFDPTDKQILIIENALTEKERTRIEELVWHHYEVNKNEPDEWY